MGSYYERGMAVYTESNNPEICAFQRKLLRKEHAFLLCLTFMFIYELVPYCFGNVNITLSLILSLILCLGVFGRRCNCTLTLYIIVQIIHASLVGTFLALQAIPYIWFNGTILFNLDTIRLDADILAVMFLWTLFIVAKGIYYIVMVRSMFIAVRMIRLRRFLATLNEEVASVEEPSMTAKVTDKVIDLSSAHVVMVSPTS